MSRSFTCPACAPRIGSPVPMIGETDGLGLPDCVRTRGGARNIVHRDIKPGNIIITKDNSARIVDFGLARVVATTSATMTGGITGTLPYMSPEQILGNNSSGGVTGRGSNKHVTYGVTMSVAEAGRVGTGGGSIKVGQT